MSMALSSVKRPRLGFVGPMLARNPGWVTTQAEVLADQFELAGYVVARTSVYPGRLRRLADTLATVSSWRGQVDVVIHAVFGGLAFGITDSASAIAKLLGVPQIFVLHGGTLPQFATARRGWVQRVIGRANAVVAPSAFLAHQFAALVPDIRIIPNIIDLDLYPYRQRTAVRPRLLWMRTFHDVYHPEMAVEVLSDLRDTHPEATLTMAGQDKGLLEPVRTLVARQGLADAVRFPGFLDAAGKTREFSTHDVYLNTNRVDNMPVSVVEAAAYGVPVVATAVGGVPYLLDDGRTGLLVPDSDAGAMADAVRRLMADPDLAATLSANGRRLAEASAWTSVQSQWEALFEEVLDVNPVVA